MPFQVAPWVPMALGSAAARGAGGLYRWADSHYINPQSAGPAVSTQTRMGKRSRTYTQTKRRSKKRSRRGRIRRALVSVPIPRSKLVKMRAVFTQQRTCTSGALSYSLFSLNDITDPFVSHATVQPLYYDQLKTLWKKACVVGASIYMRVHNGGAAACMVGIVPAPESQANTALTEYEHYLELPRCKSKMLSPDVDREVLGHAVSIKRHFGVRNLKDEDTFHCDLSTDAGPTRTAFWHVFFRPVDKTTTVTLDCVFTLDFIVLLWDRVIPARSSDA